MVLPQENAPGPIAEERGHPHDEIPSNGTQPVGKPCYRRCTRRSGYVREDGICSGVGVQVYSGQSAEKRLAHLATRGTDDVNILPLGWVVQGARLDVQPIIRCAIL